MRRRPTVYDVAEAAGVSIATVSFAFTRPQRVRPGTRDAVLAAATALGYVPSGSARGLARGRTGTIGIYSFDFQLDSSPGTGAAPDLRHFPLYVDEVQRGVQLECRSHGYALMLGAGHQAPTVIDVAGRVDGLISFAGAAPPESVAQVAQRIPVVELGGVAGRPGVHTVPVDNRGGMRAATRHLLDHHGFRRLVYLGDCDLPEFDARYAGFADACRTAGLPPPAPLASRPGDDAGTVAALRPYLSDGLPDAFVCATDQEALLVLETLAGAGVRVPEQVAVTGFDGLLGGRVGTPRLSTVHQPMERIGRTAVQILLGALEGAAPGKRDELAATFTAAASCGC